MITWLLLCSGLCHSFQLSRPQMVVDRATLVYRYPTTRGSTRLSSSHRLSNTILQRISNNDDNNFGNNPTTEKPKNWKDVMRRLKLVLLRSVPQFTPSYVTGYMLSLVWGVFSRGGPPNRGVQWGMDFGVISVLFRSCQEALNLRLLTPIWNAVFRNVLLGVYLARNNGWMGMVRTSALYGVVTYYFSRKQSRQLGSGDATTTSLQDLLQQRMGSTTRMRGQPNVSFFTTTTTSINNGAATMEDIFEKMGKTPPPNNSKTTKPSSKTSKSKKESLENALDVEWEPVDKTNLDNDEEGHQ